MPYNTVLVVHSTDRELREFVEGLKLDQEILGENNSSIVVRQGYAKLLVADTITRYQFLRINSNKDLHRFRGIRYEGIIYLNVHLPDSIVDELESRVRERSKT